MKIRYLIIFLFLTIITSTALRSEEKFKMACTINFGGPGETLIMKYKVYDNYINYYAAYNPVRNQGVFISGNDIYEIIKKTDNQITAIPKYLTTTDFIIIDLETSMIYFYETKYSEPDLKNRVKKNTFVAYKGKCNRI